MLELYCLKYAESVLPQSQVFMGGDNEKNIPISFAVYLIRTRDKNILVDTGCETMPGFCMRKYFSPVFVLRKLGLSAEEITDVVITHAHHDHIESVSRFKNAVVHITKEEYASGKSYIPDNITVDIIENQKIIDSGIRMLKWGGHSAGSAIVEIIADGDTHILAGDECYINECITRNIPTGCYCDPDKCSEFIKKFSNKKYRVHTCHDISLKTERII